VSILVFLGLSVLDLGPMYATGIRQTRSQTASSLNATPIRGGGIIRLEYLAKFSKNRPSFASGKLQ